MSALREFIAKPQNPSHCEVCPGEQTGHGRQPTVWERGIRRASVLGRPIFLVVNHEHQQASGHRRVRRRY
jgi:hypothetical protein